MNRHQCHLKRCRASLDIFTDGNGKTLAVCRLCERNARGLCRGCPNRTRPSTGKVKPFWCNTCRREQDTIRHRRAYRANPQHYREVQRQIAARRSDAQRERKRQRARDWYHAHKQPTDDYERLYRREWARRARQDPEKRARILATRRAYESQPHVKAKMKAYRRDYYRKFAA